MDEYKKILVPVDESNQSYDALKEAVSIAQRNEAHLYILTVTDMSVATVDARLIQYAKEVGEENAKRTLDKASQMVSGKIDHTTKKIEGSPKVTIVQFAKEAGIDLIVMGATGKSAVERVLVGSTTSYVIAHAPCNVMVVR
ncbi:universal stress protein [Enterococcus dongliensis]|uniref:universal stress protein n=1 Tax=Enterococcus dongliensis TaxID=2559925 RepID=UPI0028903AB5|nr:universal stress protein [Enterococcus dongliensis]MDT2612497.1 universal stress protein [Enterococcus dongliensis]